jgi:hypothetical protein
MLNGLTINANDTLWQASWHHICLAPAAAIADDRLPVRTAECFGSFECWSRSRDHLMQQGREDQARGAHADTASRAPSQATLPARD